MAIRRAGLVNVPPGAVVNVHEKRTADFLAVNLHSNVSFLVADRTKGAKTPDIEMGGLLWEIKCPTGASPRTIENNLRLGLKQSGNIILDLRRMDGRMPVRQHLYRVEKSFRDFTKIRRVVVICRDGRIVDFKR